MNHSNDCQSLLTTYNQIKQEIKNFTAQDSEPKSPEPLRLNFTTQVQRLIEVSEKLVHSLLSRGPSEDQQIQDLNKRNLKLENLYSTSEENLKKSRSEVKFLKAEIKNLEKTQGNNNLFTVEVYQSEIEDLKKDYKEKLDELENQIKVISSSSLQKSFIELRNKYVKVKDQLITLRSKIKDFEDVLADNNEQKKRTEMKYIELFETHKKMTGYIENLEAKVKSFYGRKRKRENLTESSKQSENSLVLSL